MEDKLSVLVKDSGLEKTKAQVLLDNFSDYFQIASDWEKKAKAIVVSNADQKAEMQMARTGRLFLRDKRIAIEKTRKELKEESLRESKAIDGIANVLKSVIVPIEEYLERQEKYVEIKEAEIARQLRIEAEEKAEKERIAKEKAEELERIRIREENERLKKEADEREKEIEKERARVELEKKEREENLKKEREKVDRILKEEKEKREKLRLEAEEKQLAYEKTVEEERKLAESTMIECPFCHKTFKLIGETNERKSKE